MYARVATFEGAQQDAVRRAAEQINSASGPPEGIPSSGILMLADADGGRTLMIGLFDTEDDRRQADETLKAMSPDEEGFGRRTSVDFYDVAVDRRAPSSMPT